MNSMKTSKNLGDPMASFSENQTFERRVQSKVAKRVVVMP